MTPDDPRHGTNAGYFRGCRDTCCRTAHADYHRELRAKRYLKRADRLYVPALGTQRRIRALQSLGWRLGDLDAELGHPFRSSYTMNLLRQERVHVDTARAVTGIYERLSMSIGPSATLRAKARRWGWAPPLAWDNIDDPAEQPRGWEYAEADRKSRHEILIDLDGQHAGITTACRVLKVKRDAIERWCERHGCRDIYVRMVERENQRYWRNGGAEGGVA